MEIRYNAFISYRHHPDDIRVASEIHRSLERFRVPKALRKKTRGITRLFRDKEELPITSNLTDDIEAALRNSDYLIVICSVHTRESVWVQREIELFLKTHHRSRVLTVLASGEPYDVIPEILLHEDVVDPVTGETRRVPVEPLSCDWRIKRRRARQEELPRLAAALLGCGYDELRQRQKQYRTRRLIAGISTALAASLCLSAYFLYTSIVIQRANIQIQENLEASQRNQSRHLATAAWERLAEGDRLTAISLAVAALPGEPDSRPYVPDAEYALTSALGVYDASSGITAAGVISPGANIGVRRFWTSGDDSILYLLDERDILTIWETATQKQLGSAELEYGASRLLIPTSGGNALVLGGMGDDTLTCFRPDGSVLWQTENCRDAAIYDDESAVIALCRGGDGICCLRFLSPDTGEDLRDAVGLPVQEGENNPSALCQERCIPGVSIVISCSDAGETDLWLVDPETGLRTGVLSDAGYLDAVTVTAEGKLLTMADDDTDTMAAIFDNNRTTSPIRRMVSCYDGFSAVRLWQTEVTAYNYTGLFTLEPVPGTDRLLCQSGSAFYLLDAVTGEIISRCEAGNGVLFLSVGEQFATGVLMDGYLCNYWYDENYCYETRCMEGDLLQAHRGGICFSLQREDTQVTIYRTLEKQPLWQYDFGGYLSRKNQRIHGDQLAFTDYNSLYLFDLAKKELRWKRDMGYGMAPAFSGDGAALRYVADSAWLVTVDTVTGEESRAEIPIAVGEETFYFAEEAFLTEDYLYYFGIGSEGSRPVRWDLNTRQMELLPMDIQPGKDVRFEILAVSGQHLWLWTSEGTVLELDSGTGGVQTVLEKTELRPHVALREDGGSAAITAGGVVLVRVPGSEETVQIIPERAKAGCTHYYGDTLLVLCDDGFLYRYDLTGALLSQTKLAVDSGFSGQLISAISDLSEVDWYFTQDGKLILKAFSQGNVIDCENWELCAAVDGFVAFLEGENSFLCQWQGEFRGYPRYSIPQLLQLAQEQLALFQLSAEQKLAYGIA